MKRIWGSVCSATIVIAGCALLMPACNHPDASVFIVGVVAPPTATTTGTCMYPTASASETVLFEGIVDVAVASSYQSVINVANQILPQSDPTDDRAETSSITLNKVTVHVTDSLEDPLGDYTTQVDGFVPVGSAGTPGYGNVQAELLGGQAFTYLSNEAKAHPYETFSAVSTFYFTGTTLGDVTVQSDTFSYPISVCYGCLVSFSMFETGGVCDRSGTTTPATPCFLGQDTPYSCPLCSDPICDAPGAGDAQDAGP